MKVGVAVIVLLVTGLKQSQLLVFLARATVGTSLYVLLCQLVSWLVCAFLFSKTHMGTGTSRSCRDQRFFLEVICTK